MKPPLRSVMRFFAALMVGGLVPILAHAVNYTLTVTKAGTATGTVTSSPAGIDCGATCTASLASGTSVVLTASPAAGSVLLSWSGNCSGTNSTCTVTMSAARNVTATFSPPTMTLTVSKLGAGSGTVTSSPSGIACGSSCTGSFATNSTVVLTAVPAADAIFQSWSGCTSVSGSTCNTTMTAAKTVSVTFAPAQYPLAVTTSGTGTATGTVTSSPAGINCGATCKANFANGASVVLTANPAADSVLLGWSGNCSGTNSTCTVTMSAARNVTATFSPPTMTLTVSKLGAGSGTVTSAPSGIACGSSCTGSFATNSTVVLTAVPATDAIFQSWSGCTSVSGSTCNTTMTAAKTVSVTFAPAQYPLTVTKSGSGTGRITSVPGGIDCGGTCTSAFANGASVVLTATPDTAYSFQGWSGACTGLAATCTVGMSAAKSATAAFDPPTTNLQYDANGNLTRITDPMGRIRQASYDAVERPYLIKEPHPTTVGATSGQISVAYDGQTQVAGVTDPRSLATTYTVDGLGNLLSLTSPDTGTSTGTYDEAGNLKTRLDARGKLTTYAYDALNRLTQISYGDQTVTVTWDTCTNGIGRLCQIIDGSGSTTYSYDSQGRLTGKTQSVQGVALTTGYGYNGAGQLTGITTPGGQSVAYDWTDGQVSAIRVNSTVQLTGLRYQPFGPVSGWTWGNGQTASRSFDLAGRPRTLSLGIDPKTQAADSRSLTYDAAGRVRAVVPATDLTLKQAYGYDGLDRLTATQLGEPAISNLTFSYDLSGNRASRTLNGSITNYATATTSNRLQSLSGAEAKSYGYDNAGNITTNGSVTYGYDNAGRKTSAIVAGQTSTYAYNALGQRVKKTVAGIATFFAYDEQGHLLGEYDGTGKLIQETVWLNDLPVLTLRLPAGMTVGPANVFYVHADHLGTPRRITRPADNKVMWQWESEPFGNTLPDQNPQGQGTFVYNLRFPGQYFDAETGLAYNYFRDYDPATGRYVESDPIGLRGGVNTYAYALGSPSAFIDPFGLSGWLAIYGRGNHDGSSFTGGTSGHAWITYTPDGGVTTSYSTWGNNPYGMGNGLQEDIDGGPWGARRGAYLDDAQQAKLYAIISAYKKKRQDGWGYFSPCSTFASEAWNASTGEALSPYGPYSNPSSLIRSIIDGNGGSSNGNANDPPPDP